MSRDSPSNPAAGGAGPSAAGGAGSPAAGGAGSPAAGGAGSPAAGGAGSPAAGGPVPLDTPLVPSARAVPECHGDVCITCSDEAVPVTVVRLLGDDLALVDTGVTREEVSVALVDAAVGDTVLVHAKEAIARLDGAEDAGDAGRPAGDAS